jgi:hypothetical protein
MIYRMGAGMMSLLGLLVSGYLSLGKIPCRGDVDCTRESA